MAPNASRRSSGRRPMRTRRREPAGLVGACRRALDDASKTARLSSVGRSSSLAIAARVGISTRSASPSAASRMRAPSMGSFIAPPAHQPAGLAPRAGFWLAARVSRRWGANSSGTGMGVVWLNDDVTSGWRVEPGRLGRRVPPPAAGRLARTDMAHDPRDVGSAGAETQRRWCRSCPHAMALFTPRLLFNRRTRGCRSRNEVRWARSVPRSSSERA